MAVVIDSKSKLESKIMEKYIASAMKKTQDEIYECLYKTMINFYHDYSPLWYERTFKFLKSLIKTDVKINGDTVECEIGLRGDYLDYKYPGSEWYSQPVTGLDVARWASDGLHGGRIEGIEGKKFWLYDENIEYKFLNEFKANLELRGFRVNR